MTTRTPQNTLVVDDIRVMKFEATYARTSDEARTLIGSQPWDEVWLDHDLDFTEDGIDDTTRALVAEVEKLAFEGTILPIGMFVIHTGNPVGREWLANALLPWYTVGVTTGDAWVKRLKLPWWVNQRMMEYDAEELGEQGA